MPGISMEVHRVGVRFCLDIARRPPFVKHNNNRLLVDKNSKESFIKKIHLCMKHYDYKDETKDVKGKVSPTAS